MEKHRKVEFHDKRAGLDAQICDLFASTFTASEGAEEGRLIGDLARNLLSNTRDEDIYVFSALVGGKPLAAAIFSRLVYPDDPRSVFILSPMAVAPARQGQGVGQALLSHALSRLRDDGVDVAITYGDPAFYGKIGFLPLDPATAAPPLPLRSPEGWIGQSLGDMAFYPLQGPCTCVASLNDPAIW